MPGGFQGGVISQLQFQEAKDLHHLPLKSRCSCIWGMTSRWLQYISFVVSTYFENTPMLGFLHLWRSLQDPVHSPRVLQGVCSSPLLLLEVCWGKASILKGGLQFVKGVLQNIPVPQSFRLQHVMLVLKIYSKKKIPLWYVGVLPSNNSSSLPWNK